MKQYKYRINGNLYNVTVNDIEENIANVEVNGTLYSVELEKPAKPVVAKVVTKPAAAPKTDKGAPVVSRPAASSSKSAIKSPLPGIILEIKAKEGDIVKKGQTILLLEAMKMENNINADKDGKITAIKVNKGDSVLEGTDLVIIE